MFCDVDRAINNIDDYTGIFYFYLMEESNAENQIYIYKRLYDNRSLAERIFQFKNNLRRKCILLAVKMHMIKSDHRSLKQLKQGFDITLRKDVAKSFGQQPEEETKCDYFVLSSAHYLEALEIDNFHKYQKSLVQLYKKNKWKFQHDGKRFKEDIAQLKRNFDTMSTGEMFTMKLGEEKSLNFKYIDYIKLSYTKTRENYFVLDFCVTPSKNFNDELEKIVKSNEEMISHPQFNSVFKALRGGVFVSRGTISYSKEGSLNSVMADLQYEAQAFIKMHLRGVFLNSRVKSSLPSIEVYKVPDFNKFQSDRVVYSFCHNAFDSTFINKKKDSMLFFTDRKHSENRLPVTRVVNIAAKETSVAFEFDSMLISSVQGFIKVPMVLKAILKLYYEQAYSLKRDVYDYINISYDRSISGFFKRLLRSRRTIKMKYGLAQLQVNIARFENEFKKDNVGLYFYLGNYDKENPFHEVEKRENKEERKNLGLVMQSTIDSNVSRIKSEISAVKECFDTIDSVNSSKINFALQYVSILLALLALLSFNEIKGYIANIFEYFKDIFN